MRDTAHSPRGSLSRVLAAITAIPLALTLAGVPASASPADGDSGSTAASTSSAADAGDSGAAESGDASTPATSA